MTSDEIIAWHKAHPYGARDDAYMDAVLARVKRLWRERPLERLGQMLVNVAGDEDVFLMSDEEWFDE